MQLLVLCVTGDICAKGGHAACRLVSLWFGVAVAGVGVWLQALPRLVPAPYLLAERDLVEFQVSGRTATTPAPTAASPSCSGVQWSCTQVGVS